MALSMRLKHFRNLQQKACSFVFIQVFNRIVDVYEVTLLLLDLIVFSMVTLS